MHELSDAQVGRVTLTVLGAMIALMIAIVVVVYGYAIASGYWVPL
jgi:hypothetical protein